MNIFIVFVKFLGCIVSIWMRLVRFIEEKRDLRFWKGPATKIKHIITKKEIWTQGARALGPPPGFILAQRLRAVSPLVTKQSAFVQFI